VSRLIGEALPNDTSQRAFRALHVIYSEADAVAIAEVKFREVNSDCVMACALLTYHMTAATIAASMITDLNPRRIPSIPLAYRP
jgi:hypothetical protein